MVVVVAASLTKIRLSYPQMTPKMMKGVQKNLEVLARPPDCLIEPFPAAVGRDSLLLRPILRTALVVAC